LAQTPRECLDRPLIVAPRQLEHVLPADTSHYNAGRPHRFLDLTPPDSSALSPARADPTTHVPQLSRRDLLGGLIHECENAAAA
jgi:hypothetical protein